MVQRQLHAAYHALASDHTLTHSTYLLHVCESLVSSLVGCLVHVITYTCDQFTLSNLFTAPVYRLIQMLNGIVPWLEQLPNTAHTCIAV